jgi:hypothetical protein
VVRGGAAALVVAEGVAVEEAAAVAGAGTDEAKPLAAAFALGVVGGGGNVMVKGFCDVVSIGLLCLCLWFVWWWSSWVGWH